MLSKMKWKSSASLTAFTSKTAALILLTFPIIVFFPWWLSDMLVAYQRASSQDRAHRNSFFSTRPSYVEPSAASSLSSLHFARRKTRRQFRVLALNDSWRNSGPYPSFAEGKLPPPLSRSSSIFASSVCVDASWLENQGFTQTDFVHDAHVLKSVWCVAGSSLPCGTDDHAVSVNGVTTSYSKLCDDPKLRCTRREMHVNSVWSFHPAAQHGIDVADDKQWKLYMHDVRFPFAAQYALHTVQASARHFLQQLKGKQATPVLRKEEANLGVQEMKKRLVLQKTQINLADTSRISCLPRRFLLRTIISCGLCRVRVHCSGMLLCRDNLCSPRNATCFTDSPCGNPYRCHYQLKRIRNCWRLAPTRPFCDVSRNCGGLRWCPDYRCSVHRAPCITRLLCISRQSCHSRGRSIENKCKRLAFAGEFCDREEDCSGSLLCLANRCSLSSPSPRPSRSPSPSPAASENVSSVCSQNSQCGSGLVCRRYSKTTREARSADKNRQPVSTVKTTRIV